MPPPSRRHLALAGLVLLVAAWLRCADLDLKPAHYDEGNNGWLVDRMRKDGFYRYDPANYHGPLYFYLLQASETFFGRSLTALRLPSALAGIGVVALALWGFRRQIGDRASLWFGGWLAVSPAMVFVSRYAIHEMFMLLFLMLAALGLCEHWAGRRGAWLISLGIAGMVLTKETYVIHLACVGLAWVVWRVLQRRWPGRPPASPRTEAACDFIWPALIGIAAVLFIYSGTLLNPRGVAGLWQTFAFWTHTGTSGNGHEKPWFYWLGLLARYEWIAAVGFIASVTFLRNSTKGLRIVIIAGAGTLAACSLIPYKTPWCIITIMWTAPLALAICLDQVAQRSRRWLVGASLIGGLLGGHDLFAAIRLNWRHYDNPREPYVYVQTPRDVTRLVDPLRSAAAADPMLLGRRGVIIGDATHPLPWLLGEFTSVTQLPNDATVIDWVANADFVLVTAERSADVEKHLSGEFRVSAASIRNGEPAMFAYFRKSVFDPWVDPYAAPLHFGPAGKAAR